MTSSVNVHYHNVQLSTNENPELTLIIYSVRKPKIAFGTSPFCDVVHVGSTLFIPLSIRCKNIPITTSAKSPSCALI